MLETSYKIKYAVNRTLNCIHPDDINIGEAVKKVLQHEHLRGKFTIISEFFKDMGVTRIDIGEDGLTFVGYNPSKINILIIHFPS